MISLLLRRAALVHRKRIATIEAGRVRDYAQFEGRVAHIAGALRSGGLTPGDRVAVLSGNRPEYLELYFAIAWAGGVIVPLNNRSHVREMAFWLSDSGATALVIEAGFAPLQEDLCAESAELRDVIMIDGTDANAYERRLEAATPVEPYAARSEELAGIFYTGGTTGRSKGVMLSHGNLVTNALQYSMENDYGPDSIFLHAAPMFHLADGASDFALTIAGSAHAFLPQFEIETLLGMIADHKITNVVLVPTMIQRMLEHPDLSRFDLSSLRTIGYGAAPMPENVLRKAMELLPGCGFIQAYGMTELSPVATILPREYHCVDGPLAGKLRSTGRPTFGVELRVVDEEGRPVQAGTVGEVTVRGPTVMMGYWNLPEETAAAIRGGWMHTGDAGRMDEDGFLYIEDRIKDMIISGGENVYPAEVENALLSHPDVAQCAVIGLPSDRWGEAVHAVVVLRGGAEADEAALISYARDRLTAFKCPKTVEFVDFLPLTGAGKVQKAVLRSPEWRRR